MTKKTDDVAAKTETGQSISRTLEYPIAYGADGKLKELTFRRPMGGDLRGIKLIKLSELDSDVLFDLLPRITTPAINASHVQALDPVDTVGIMNDLAGFFTV